MVTELSTEKSPQPGHQIGLVPDLNVAGVQPAAGQGFIADWDRLERLVIDVYRRGESDEKGGAEGGWLRRAVAERHDGAAMAPHWRGALAGGEALAGDPFLTLTAIPWAADLVGNRRAMQLRSAAREALNRWLLMLWDGAA